MLCLQVVTFLPALEDRPSTGFLMFDLILSTVHFLKIISVAVEMTLLTGMWKGHRLHSWYACFPTISNLLYGLFVDFSILIPLRTKYKTCQKQDGN